MYKSIALGEAKGDRTLAQKALKIICVHLRHQPQSAVKKKTNRLAYHHKKYKR